MKEFSRLRVGAGIDECSDVGIAGGDDPVKGRIDLFERLQLLEAPHVGGTGFRRSLHRAEIAYRLVGFLLRYRAVADQVLPASCGDLGNIQVGLRRIQVRSGLQQLLVDFRSFYLRKQLALLDMRANIEVPAPEIAAGSRIDWRIAECLRVAGQDYFLRGCALLRKDYVD